jgi:hypothetical protein
VLLGPLKHELHVAPRRIEGPPRLDDPVKVSIKLTTILPQDEECPSSIEAKGMLYIVQHNYLLPIRIIVRF